MNTNKSELNLSNVSKDYSTMRRWPRFHIDVRVRATVHTCDRNVVVHGRGNEISEGGMAAFLSVDLVVGEKILIDITLPYVSQPLKLLAIVRNRSSFCYGLEFAGITPAQKSEITKACRALTLMQ